MNIRGDIEDFCTMLEKSWKEQNYNSIEARNVIIAGMGGSGIIGIIAKKIMEQDGNKIITSGGGGAILMNKKLLFIKAKHMSNQSKSNQIYFKHNMIGYNYRINNIQAALGLAQIENINFFIKNKKLINEKYKYYINKNHQSHIEILK